MSNRFKSPVFNNAYLTNLETFLAKESIDAPQKILLLTRLQKAIKGTMLGERSDAYRELKKSPTEIKAIELIIEKFVKKTVELPMVPSDYSEGLFSIIRKHAKPLQDAIVTIVTQELPSCTFPEPTSIRDMLDNRLLNNSIESLDVLLSLRSEMPDRGTSSITYTCEQLINYICSICDRIAQATKSQTFTSLQEAYECLELCRGYHDQICDLWGRLRFMFLMTNMREYILARAPQETSTKEAQETHETAKNHTGKYIFTPDDNTTTAPKSEAHCDSECSCDNH